TACPFVQDCPLNYRSQLVRKALVRKGKLDESLHLRPHERRAYSVARTAANVVLEVYNAAGTPIVSAVVHDLALESPDRNGCEAHGSFPNTGPRRRLRGACWMAGSPGRAPDGGRGAGCSRYGCTMTA